MNVYDILDSGKENGKYLKQYILDHSLHYDNVNPGNNRYLLSLIPSKESKLPSINLHITNFHKGYSNFYIELGGEVYVSGLNRENQKWKIGIDTPISSSKERSISEVLSISNEAIATSGNYRKFYEVKGKKYAHTIDPKTGLQVTHNLLSATVIAKDCATADGFATAFMVMGKEKTIAFLKQNRDLGLTVYLIYNEKGSMKSYASDSSKLFSL